MAKGSKRKQVADLLDVDDVDVRAVCLRLLGPVPGWRPDREQMRSRPEIQAEKHVRPLHIMAHLGHCIINL